MKVEFYFKKQKQMQFEKKSKSMTLHIQLGIFVSSLDELHICSVINANVIISNALDI